MTRLRGDPLAGVTALSAFMGQFDPEADPDQRFDAQQDGALLVYCFMRDMHMIRQAITNDPKKRRPDPIDD